MVSYFIILKQHFQNYAVTTDKINGVLFAINQTKILLGYFVISIQLLLKHLFVITD